MSDANSNNNDDDAEKMRLDFEAFMLAGNKKSASDQKKDDSSAIGASGSKKKKKKKKKSSLGGGGIGGGGARGMATPPNKSSSPMDADDEDDASQMTTISTPVQSASTRSERKRYYQLLRSFNDKVRNTWYDLDDQLLSVLNNLVSIRGRLPAEWKLLQSSTLTKGECETSAQKDELAVVEEDDEDEWKYHGPSGKPKETPHSFHLHVADVELALSHDMMQHEKMLAGVRSLMSNLAECHEALGRMVDTLWKFHLDCTGGEEGAEGEGGVERDSDGDGMQHLVECATEAFHMLSAELYRKQRLVSLAFESTDDELLGIDISGGRGDGPGSSSGGGLRAARKVAKSWPRSGEASCVDEDRMSRLMTLGEARHKNST